MKYRRFMTGIKRSKLKSLDVARVLGIGEKELNDKLRGKKPLYIHEAELIFECLGIENGKDKIKFF